MPLGTCTLVHCSEDSLLTTAPGEWGEEGRERGGGKGGGERDGRRKGSRGNNERKTCLGKKRTLEYSQDGSSEC